MFSNSGVEVAIKREDLIHPFVSGNKWRKLKYNLKNAIENGESTLLTFGGAYSNHIYAVAAAAEELGLQSIGIIRGDELASKPLNPTLQFAASKGMQLNFISREQYRLKTSEEFKNSLKNKFGSFYLLPEGGTNDLAIKGCEEILDVETSEYDYVVCSIGTGGTIAGITRAALPHQKILGISSLKGDFIINDVYELLHEKHNEKLRIFTKYHFGGYGKVSPELIHFIREFESDHNILLDPIYTGKTLYAIYDLIKNHFFPKGAKILMIHTGGLQGRTATPGDSENNR